MACLAILAEGQRRIAWLHDYCMTGFMAERLTERVLH